MPLSRELKEERVQEYVELLEKSKAIIFTEFRGLSNRQMTELRDKVLEADGSYHVTKLSLLHIALEQAGYDVPEMLDGKPIATGFCLEEIPSVAKALTDFADETEFLTIHGGMMASGAFLTAQQIDGLAELPPLETLRAQLAGLLDAPASNLVGVLQSGVAQVINVINAYAEQGKGGEAAPAAS